LQFTGELPEWSNGADSKSVVPLCGTGGSNPSLSANKNNCPERGIFVFGQLPSSLEQLEEKKDDKGEALQLLLLKLLQKGITTKGSNPLSI
jgi:hypothetical protein